MAGYDVGIRKQLVNKGVSNADIGYNPTTGSVTVKGKDFMKGDKSYAGTNYTNSQNFNNAWSAYNQASNKQPQGGMPAGYGSGYQPAAQTNQRPVQLPQTQPNQQPQAMPYNPYNQTTSQNPYTTQADNVIKQLMNYGQNQGNFDPYSSSGYKAAEAQAARGVQQSTRQAQEAYGSAGFGRSTGLGERVAGIGNEAQEYLMTQVVPQLEAQESARRQQEYNNTLSALQQLVGQQNRADDLVQNNFSNKIAEGQLTGNYMNPEASFIIDQLLGLKQQAETKGITADARAGLSSQADVYRNQLQALGLDPSLFGANVTANQAGANRGVAGRTTAGQELDQRISSDLRDYERGVLESNRDFEYTQGRDKVKDAQWQTEFNRIAEQDGIQNAISWANQTLNREEFEDRSARDWANLDFDMANEGAEAKGTFTPTQVYSDIKQKYPDFFDGEEVAAPSDYEAMYRDVINYGLDEAAENDILRAIGMSDAQVAEFDKKYLGNP